MSTPNISIRKDANGIVWVDFTVAGRPVARLNLSHAIGLESVAPGFSYKDMCEALREFPVLEARVRDGVIMKGSMVWWRATSGPQHVCSDDGNHWDNILRHGQEYYQIAEPRTRSVVYAD